MNEIIIYETTGTEIPRRRRIATKPVVLVLTFATAFVIGGAMPGDVAAILTGAVLALIPGAVWAVLHD